MQTAFAPSSRIVPKKAIDQTVTAPHFGESILKKSKMVKEMAIKNQEKKPQLTEKKNGCSAEKINYHMEKRNGRMRKINYHMGKRNDRIGKINCHMKKKNG